MYRPLPFCQFRPLPFCQFFTFISSLPALLVPIALDLFEEEPRLTIRISAVVSSQMRNLVADSREMRRGIFSALMQLEIGIKSFLLRLS